MTKKKALLFGGGAIVLVLLVTLIVILTAGSKTPDILVNTESTDSGLTVNDVSDVTSDNNVSMVDLPNVEDTGTESSESDAILDPEKGGSVEVNLSEIEKEATPPPKPQVKDESQLTNPNQEPSYAEEDTKINPDSNTPQNGEKKNGMIYIDGFGWIKDEGGGTVEKSFDSDGDINKQVGNMGN
ncbi:DUF6550 family protein [Fumia xinanensis]|uniref:Uncharacterized protein n=1 Tax=Fumia xinanensis TaxID=2763659 RepID=A0A926I797_9FIRM|nr:DUF6550 family protein [Fumia xinanensis]MBC8560745.1 hypothetical protein [Fumia xinanensis]